MSLWLKTRRAPLSIALVLLLSLAVPPLSGLYLPIPNLFGGAADVPVVLILPVGVAITTCWSLAGGYTLLEMVSSRPVWSLDTLWAVSLAGLFLLVCLAESATAGPPLAVSAGRNALGYLGLALMGRQLLGKEAGAVLPTAFLLLTAMFGTTPYREPQPWAWPLHPANSPIAWGLAILLLVAGAWLSVRSNPPIRGEE